MPIRSRRAVATLAAAALATPLLLASAPSASAHRDGAGGDAARLSRALVGAASAEGAHRHLERLQAIADSTGGHRVAGSLGHDASAAYVYSRLKKAGYRVSYQSFEFIYTETLAERLATVAPAPQDVEIRAMTYTTSTPVGGVTAELAAVPVDADGTTGCEPGDYAEGAFTGRIALVKRGGCAFATKQQRAADAGAIGAVIYNNIDTGYGPLSGTLSDPSAARIPTGGISLADGERLAAEAARGPVALRFEIRQLQEKRLTRNVLAETPRGDAARTVMLGAHLDSVKAGPGINDNGSGSAALLDVALKFAQKENRPRNKVRFAWWSAEEFGLVGSNHHVGALTPRQRQEVRLYLDFSTIASPNYGLFVFDGDGSDGANTTPVPEGSAQLERDIASFLDRRGLPHAGTPFVSRSDYTAFLLAGIPAGGTFAGAEAIKTEAEAALFGGTAGVAFHADYHGPGDTLGNISMRALDVHTDVIANAVGTYAHDLGALGEPAPSAAPRGAAGAADASRSAHGPGAAG
ncbi:M28 family peptidase [Streptomyces sp. NPDC047999]|uniref:M28 family peptidase n=1 Tax=unclassified Streptomyces TaxID=2593676 RepID=UPI00371C88EE